MSNEVREVPQFAVAQALSLVTLLEPTMITFIPQLSILHSRAKLIFVPLLTFPSHRWLYRQVDPC